MAIVRSLLLSGHRSSSSFSSFFRLFTSFSRLNSIVLSAQLAYSTPISKSPLPVVSPQTHLLRQFASNPEENPKSANSKLVNFSLPSSDSESDSEEDHKLKTKQEGIKNPNLPPPYDPFNKNSSITDREDPKNLQKVFHTMRTEGLLNNAVKMFDALSKDGLTHEALELFKVIKDNGNMPEVVAHTAVLEAYMGGGQSEEGRKVFLRMLASGVSPNTYTYSVLIKGLASATGDPRALADAKKYMVEMLEKGMKPNSETCVAVLRAVVREGREEEGRELVEVLKGKGFVPDEKGVREVLKGERGPVFRSVMNILFGK